LSVLTSHNIPISFKVIIKRI